MVKKIIPILLIFALLGVAVYALSHRLPREDGTASGDIRVVTSVYPVYFLATQIGGEHATVTNLTPPGVEPHDYEPTAQEIARIMESDLLILNGAGLETWANKLTRQLTRTRTVVAGESVATGNFEEGGDTVRDPHVWLSPPLAKAEAHTIAQGFIAIDPVHQGEYEANAQSLEDKLDVLDKKFIAGLRTCKTRDFVTSHAAFGYLADRYGLNQIPIAGLSPNEEPGAGKLAEVANLVKAKEIKYIFFESLISPKLAETIARETGAQTLILDPIEGLTEEEQRAGKNYMTQMELNLNNLKLALECTT